MKFKIGDRVRIKPEPKETTYGRAGVTSDEIGRITAIWGSYVNVAFPSLAIDNWLGHNSELELVPESPIVLPAVYKQVAIRGGKYQSCFIGVKGYNYNGSAIRDLPELWENPLEYNIGQVTVSPTVNGIFCYGDKDIALDRARDRNNVTNGISALLECYPIGHEITTRVEEMSMSLRYPAVYVIREIWREDEPKEEWVDVTEECQFRISIGGVNVYHDGKRIGVIGLLPFVPLTSSDYKVESSQASYSSRIELGRIYKQVTK